MVTGHGAEDAGIGFQPGLGAGHHGAADARPEGTSPTAPIDRVRPAPQRCGSCRPRTRRPAAPTRRAALRRPPGPDAELGGINVARHVLRRGPHRTLPPRGSPHAPPAVADRPQLCGPSARPAPDGLGLLHPAGDDTGTPLRFPLVCRPATYPRPAVSPAHCPRWRRPGERPRPAPAAPPSEPCRCPGESARPAARPRSWNLAGREPRQNMPPISTPAARGGYPGRVCAGSRGEHGAIINWPRTTAHSWRVGG
jgi:hypothetical protein